MRLSPTGPVFIALIVILGVLGGCFGSRTPLLASKESLKLFGESGIARRVEFDQLGGPLSQTVRFTWRDGSYVMADRGTRRPAAYRLAKLEPGKAGGVWLISEMFDQDSAAYGLARRDGDRLWTYAPECRDLSDEDRARLAIVMQADGTCWMTSLKQLRGAMAALAAKNPKPDGYYELIPGN